VCVERDSPNEISLMKLPRDPKNEKGKTVQKTRFSKELVETGTVEILVCTERRINM